jgi:hypothetical protein
MRLPLSNLRTYLSPSTSARRLLPAALAASLGVVGIAPLFAAPQDAPACGEFAWPVAREIKLFRDSGIEPVMSGATLRALPPTGVSVELQPQVTVDYLLAPERESKADDSGGMLAILNVAQAGAYQVTASEEAWIDAIQNGKALSPTADTSKEGCPDVRKSMRFSLDAGPLTIQVSGATSRLIKLAILPVE